MILNLNFIVGGSMESFKVSKNEAGQRFDKLLMKRLNKAPKGFIYKMLRKKNITLNANKAKGSEILKENDEVTLFLSDDTIRKFTKDIGETIDTITIKEEIDIVFEDEHILVVNKGLGQLSQKSSPNDISLNEQILSYLTRTKYIDKEEIQTFKPSICNRLDRNTSGLIIAGKTLLSLQTISELFRKASIGRYYLTIVCGTIRDKGKISAYLSKDKKINKVRISQDEKANTSKVEIEYEEIGTSKGFTLLKVKLITGKTHQIRALLAHIKHPIIGDYKYGIKKANDVFKTKYNLHHQLLHSYLMSFPLVKGELNYLSGKTYKAKEPELFLQIRKDLNL